MLRRVDTGTPGVILLCGVPIMDAAGQRAHAYLHLACERRSKPSHVLRFFLTTDGVDASSKRDHPAYAGEYQAYDSPIPAGPARAASPGDPLPASQGSYEALVDISAAMRRLDAADSLDLTIVALDLRGAPLRADDFVFERVVVTRRRE